jgi:hypothetical protein
LLFLLFPLSFARTLLFALRSTFLTRGDLLLALLLALLTELLWGTVRSLLLFRFSLLLLLLLLEFLPLRLPIGALRLWLSLLGIQLLLLLLLF